MLVVVVRGTSSRDGGAGRLRQYDVDVGVQSLRVDRLAKHDAEWLRAERARLYELRVEALTRLLPHQTEAGATEAAIQTAGRLLALDPLPEVLMRLYLRQGRRAAALRQYEVCLQALERDLGVEPEAETSELCRALLPRAVAAPSARVAPRH